jgi:hypothetical protein
MNKPFDPVLYAEHDLVGKQRVARFMFNAGYDVREGSQYGIDLLLYKDDELVCGVEVEQRDFGGRCRYESIHVAQRKQKFFAGEQCHNLLFAVDMGGLYAYYTNGYRITKSPLVQLDNKLCAGEFFFDVPIDLWKEVQL